MTACVLLCLRHATCLFTEVSPCSKLYIQKALKTFPSLLDGITEKQTQTAFPAHCVFPPCSSAHIALHSEITLSQFLLVFLYLHQTRVVHRCAFSPFRQSHKTSSLPMFASPLSVDTGLRNVSIVPYNCD